MVWTGEENTLRYNYFRAELFRGEWRCPVYYCTRSWWDWVHGLLDGRHLLYAQSDLQTAGDVPGVETPLLVRCVVQNDGCPIAEMGARKQSSFACKVTSTVRCDSSFVVIVKSVISFSAAFKKEHGASFLVAWTVRIVELMVSSDFLSVNSPQT